MKYIYGLIVFCFIALHSLDLKAAVGDTVKVQTFTFGSKQDSVFLFPPDTFSCSKVLMYYKLRCPSGGCGQWDYLTYTFLYQPTGKIDSYQVNQPYFLVNGNQYDSFAFMKDTSWKYSYNSKTKRTDSSAQGSLQMVFYRNSSKPWLPTDTMTVWPAYSRIIFDSTGKNPDTIAVKTDSLLHQKYAIYYVKYPDNIRYELARYITPYGIGLSLGSGFTWVYDVSDYRHLLHDSVHLSGGNWQEQLEMTFVFIKGTPPREVKKIENLWNGDPAYGTSTSIENFLSPKKVKMDPNGSNWRIKMRTTGHGFGGTDDCAEFCPRLHSMDVNGVTRFADTMFRYDCSLNPVYPQGGTWIYSRSNWCPGSSVKTYDYELTPYVKAGDSVTLDYNVQPYTWNGVGTTPYYDIETQLVTYGPPNFKTDAAVDDIIAPSNADIYKRMNPVCGGPKIRIKNNGSDPLTSLDISYGVEGTTPYQFHWTGNLNFLDTQTVNLPDMNWTGASNIFKVSLSNPNGGTDDYPADDVMSTYYTLPPSLASQFIIIFHSNNDPADNSYTLKNAYGGVILNRSGFSANTTYRDTMNLKDGCYTLELTDLGGDGLDWWGNPAQGSGYFDIRKIKGGYYEQFGTDFGSQIYYQFTVGSFANGIADTKQPVINMAVYPNPNDGNFNISIGLPQREKITISVLDAFGREVLTQHEEMDQGDIPLQLNTVAKGWYIVKLSTQEGIYCKKVFVK